LSVIVLGKNSATTGQCVLGMGHYRALWQGS